MKSARLTVTRLDELRALAAAWSGADLGLRFAFQRLAGTALAEALMHIDYLTACADCGKPEGEDHAACGVDEKRTESCNVTLTIGAGKHRALVNFTDSAGLPKRFECANEIRAIDVECLHVVGPHRMDIQLIRGDMPQMSFSQLPDDHLESRGAASCRGLVVPARQGWYIVVSREFACDEPSAVTLRVTQQFVLGDRL